MYCVVCKEKICIDEVGLDFPIGATKLCEVIIPEISQSLDPNVYEIFLDETEAIDFFS